MSVRIKTSREHETALERFDALMESDPIPGTPLGDELQVLARSIEDYEKHHCDLGHPTPLEALRFRMEQQGLKSEELVKYLGSASEVSDVLSGKRSLSDDMIQRLRDGLGIPLTS